MKLTISLSNSLANWPCSRMVPRTKASTLQFLSYRHFLQTIAPHVRLQLLGWSMSMLILLLRLRRVWSSCGS